MEIDKNATTFVIKNLNMLSPFWSPGKRLKDRFNISDESILKKNLESWHYKHASLSFWKHQLGEAEFNSCFKFSFVRNSWDRVVSLYFRDEAGEYRDVMTFREFVDWILNASDTCSSFGENDETYREEYDLKCPGYGPEFDGDDAFKPWRGKRRHQLSYLTVDEKVSIDFWGDIKKGRPDLGLTNFKQCIHHTHERVGVPAPLDLFMQKWTEELFDPNLLSPKGKRLHQINVSPNRNQKVHYSIYYDDEMRDIIGEKFKKDNEFFGFEFEDHRLREGKDQLNETRKSLQLDYF